MNQPEKDLQVNIFQVERDRLTRELFLLLTGGVDTAGRSSLRSQR